MTGLPVYPHDHVPLAREAGPLWLHAVELAACLALGQRALVVGPHASGKTTILRELGRSVAEHRPDVELHAVLVDRPVEEFLEWRHELPQASVHGSSSDEPPEDHVAIEAPFAAARETCDAGRHAMVLVDSLASLARALNVTMPHDERILTGGIMATALRETRNLFGTARALEGAGSLTVVAVADVDTERELDEVVFQELVGTGNMEIRTSGEARDAGLFPPLDIAGSGARHTEQILGIEAADARARLRSEVTGHGVTAGLSLLLGELERAGSLDALLT